jgi:hypothetical protein
MMLTLSNKPFTFDGSLYLYDEVFFDEELNQEVAFYKTLPNKITSKCSAGSCALFIWNNAKPNEDLQYGIKIFDYDTEKKCKQEAYNSFLRQKAAASQDLAPPAHFMVKIYRNGRMCWGYTTSVAEDTTYVLLPEFEADNMYQEYVASFNLDKEYAISNLSNVLKCYNLAHIQNDANDLMDKLQESDPMEFDAWIVYNEYNLVDTDPLQAALECVEVMIDGYIVYLGGDLHSANIGHYKGDLVCVDFSHHSEG